MLSFFSSFSEKHMIDQPATRLSLGIFYELGTTGANVHEVKNLLCCSSCRPLRWHPRWWYSSTVHNLPQSRLRILTCTTSLEMAVVELFRTKICA